MSNLANQLVLTERDELARAIRVLLAHPLLTKRHDPDAFDLVRRRREPLTRWFDYTLGWNLVVEPRLGHARLLKVRSYADGDRPARRPRAGRAPLDRRRYILLCVACAELLAVPVTTIGLLADRVVQAMAADEALPGFDTARRDERMAFVDVLKLLESYGALRTLDGATDTYAEASDAKVLYQVEAAVLLRLLAAPTSPSAPASMSTPGTEPEPEPESESEPQSAPGRFEELLQALAHERRYGGPAPGLDDGVQDSVPSAQRNLWLRHSVLRRLFDDPVLYRDELSEAELGYLTSLTGRQILRRTAEQAGFVLEERAEGWLLADPEALATDGKFPDDSGHAKVAALLLLDRLADAEAGATVEQLTAEAAGILARFPGWGKAYRSEDGTARLAEDAVAHLADFGLVRREAGRVTARPAAARYRLTHTEEQHRPTPAARQTGNPS